MPVLNSRAAAHARRYVAAQVVVVLLFGPYIANLLKELTRYLYMWRSADVLLLLGSMILLASACVAARELLTRCGRGGLTRLFDHLFVVALGAGLLANLWFHTNRSRGYHLAQFGIEIQGAWLGLVALAGYSLARRESRLVLRCRQLCQILSPVPVILAMQLFWQPTYPCAPAPFPSPAQPGMLRVAQASRPTGPVYLFVFDEWSYERTFEQGQVRPELAYLSRLAQQAVVFHDAHSGGEYTATAMPRLLFQTPMEPAHEHGRVGFRHEGALLPSRDCESIFRAVPDYPARSFMIGFFLPYSVWLADQVDVCRSYCWYPRGQNAAARLATHVLGAMQYWTDPWSHLLYLRQKKRLENASFVEMFDALRRDTLRVIQEPGNNTFAVFHLPLPHYPYAFNEDGSLRTPDRQDWVKGDLEGYQRNLRLMDHLLGEFIGAMTGEGRFDDALIILTSDHTWRYDPARTAQKNAGPATHVPLIVKWPRQLRPLSLASRFEHWRLGGLIRLALQNPGDPEAVRQLVETDMVDAAPIGPPDPLTGNGVVARPCY